jgi:hypothetical protein
MWPREPRTNPAAIREQPDSIRAGNILHRLADACRIPPERRGLLWEANMKRRPEDLTLSATASGAMLVAGLAVIFILWAIFAGVGVATPAVSQNLAAIGF